MQEITAYYTLDAAVTLVDMNQPELARTKLVPLAARDDDIGQVAQHFIAERDGFLSSRDQHMRMAELQVRHLREQRAHEPLTAAEAVTLARAVGTCPPPAAPATRGPRCCRTCAKRRRRSPRTSRSQS